MADLYTDRITKIIIYDESESEQGAIVIDNNSEIGIEAGTLYKKEMIVDSELKFGAIYSTMFSVTIYNIDTDITGKRITVQQIYNESTHNVFKGKIDSAKADRSGVYRDVIAYDDLYELRSKNVSSFWNEFWLNRDNATIRTFRDALTDYLGITVVEKTLINDSTLIRSNGDTYNTIPFGDVFSMICELQATIPHINEDGELEYITFSTTSIDVLDNYEGENSYWEDFTTQEITGVGVYTESSTLTQLIGTADNTYKISGNIFLLNMTGTEITNCCENILDVLETIQYKPCTLKMIISDPTLKLGQKINTDYGYSYIMSIEYSGMIMIDQTIAGVASGETLSDYADSYADFMATDRKFSRIQQTIDEIVAEVTSIDVIRANLILNSIDMKYHYFTALAPHTHNEMANYTHNALSAFTHNTLGGE